MKNQPTPARRAAWLFLAAPALLAAPAIAQDASTAPPPVRPTVPQATAPVTAPRVATPAPPVAQTQAPPPSRETGRPVQANTVNPNSPTTIAPGAGDVVDDARRPAARAERTAPARQATRAQTVTRTTTAAPAAIAPAPAPAPEPLIPPATVPEATAPAPVAEPVAPVADTAATETTTATTSEGGVPLWPLALVVVAILAAGAFFLMRSRRREAEYDEYEAETTYHEAEPAHVEPVPAAVATERPGIAPAVAAMPIAAAAVAGEPVVATADDAVVSDAPAEDVAALTDAAPPVRNRPWLEFAMRPVRAGTSADEALVEIELTVANSGSIAAKDVRVSTFMLTDAHASEMENMLVDTPADAAIDPVTIDPGEGTRIDATLAALKADLGGEGRFTPVVVADARYTLPDGSEGRTSASFVVGVSGDEGGTLIPIDLADRVMRDDIEARLHGAVEHA